ncbi:MAG: T9SS type A sorting domain-containing protein [Bacteroidetes bacterium]|nr:T9SS type A sorting domain-containing protein [Bacteroidota bacterium]
MKTSKAKAGFVKHLIFLTFLFITLSGNGLRAQLVVQTNLTPEQLVQQVLVGSGVSVSNVTYQGNNFMRGSFTNGHATNLGLDGGVALASGNVLQIPNHVSVFANSAYGLAGDPTLNGIATALTHDASVLEFDFVPTADTLRFRYVFGSEEYHEWVNSTFNDVFGFFVNGPKPNGLGNYVDYNIALIPGTALPVSINNVNLGSFPQYLVDNEGMQGTTIVYDAFTTVFTALLVVVPCEQYHIKLAIGDAGDAAYDSGVFLEANSFSSTGLSSNLGFSNSSNWFGAAVEACNDAELTFILDETMNDDYYIVRQQTFGSATLDLDYGLSPSGDTLWIPAGELEVTLNLFPYSDDLVEGTETARFIFEFMEGCDPTADTTAIDILDNTTAIPTFGIISEFCEDGDSVLLSGSPSGGVFTGPGIIGNTFYPNLANNGLNEIFYTIYYIDVTAFGIDTICTNDVMEEVWVYANPDVDAGPDAIIAEGETFTPASAAHDYEYVEWSTSGTGAFNDINIISPVYSPSIEDVTAGQVTLTIYAAPHVPCAGDTSDAMVLTIASGTTALSGEDDAICEGMTYQLNGNALFYSTIEWTSSGDGTFSDPGILNPVYTPGAIDILNEGATLTLTAYGSSVHSDDMYLSIGPKPLVDLGPDRYIPHGIWIDLNSDVIGGSGNFIYWWEPSDMLVNPTLANPQTHNIYATTTFTLFVTDMETACESEYASVDVIIDGDPLGALPFAEPSVSCSGSNVQLFAGALGGDGTYENFLWTADPGGNTYAFENPIVEINEPATFFLDFSDGYNNYTASLFVDLLPDPVVELGGPVQIHCLYEQVILDAGNPGSSYDWSTGDTTQQITVLTTGLAYDPQEFSVEVVNAEGCTGSAEVTIIFDFDACLGIDDPSHSGHFRIYPNPSYGLFNIEIEGYEGETVLSVLNVNGVEVYHETLQLQSHGFKTEINLSSYGKGLYYIRFLNAQFQHAGKIIIR